MSAIKLEVENLEQLKRALTEYPRTSQKFLQAAGRESAEEIIETEGLRRYPPSGVGNMPPAPFYIRGRGTQLASGRNLGNSERLGTQWYVKPSGANTTIGNRASYAQFVHGERQNRYMTAIGWRRLVDVAGEKIIKITEIYNGWISLLVEQLFGDIR